MYLRSSRADSISWKSRKTRASSYNRLIPRTILQNDGCGRMNGPSRNWTIENKRKETTEAYTPLSDVQCLGGALTCGAETYIRRLSRPSSRTSWVVATYASAQRARARAVNVKGLKKNLRQTLLSGARQYSGYYGRRTPRLCPSSLGRARSWCTAPFYPPEHNLKLRRASWYTE